MKWIVFENPGLIDPDLIHMIGMTSKRDDDNKIGEFGSGLKFTLAYLGRNNIPIRIFRGEDEIVVNYQQKEGHDFKIITLDGDKTSITTGMGPGWKDWYCYRELFANMLDEGGDHVTIRDEVKGRPNHTLFAIPLLNFFDIHNSWSIYYKPDIPQNAMRMKLRYESKGDYFAVERSDNMVNVYKHGFLIENIKLADKRIGFDMWYDDLKINELREIDSSSNLKWCLNQRYFEPQSGYEPHFIQFMMKTMSLLENRDLSEVDPSQWNDPTKEEFVNQAVDMGFKIRPVTLKNAVDSMNEKQFTFFTNDSTILSRYNEKTHELGNFDPSVGSTIHPFNDRYRWYNEIMEFYKNVQESFSSTLVKEDLDGETIVQERKWPDILVAELEDSAIKGVFQKASNRIIFNQRMFTPGDSFYALDTILKVLWEEVHYFLSGERDESRGFQTYALNNWFELWRSLH